MSKVFTALKRSAAWLDFARSSDTLPFLRQVIRRVVGLEVDPLPGGQVQPVQVCAVDVTRCPSKHVQEAIYNDHCLELGRYDMAA